jgi:uncharacterized metal-binding protein YceD (DUF177 family)
MDDVATPLYIVDISPLLAERGGVPFAIPTFSVDSRFDEAGVTARATFRVDRTNRGVRIYGQVEGVQRDTCGRCLVPVAIPLSATVDEDAVESRYATGEELVIGKGNSIDLGRLAVDALDLVQVLAPLCTPPCPERCGLCGGEHPIDACPSRGVDPRLAGLAALLPPGDDEAQIG